MSPGSPDQTGSRVTLHVWRVPGSRLPRVLWRMARDRGRLRATPGVAFAKLLGTGQNRRFGPAQIDSGRWAAIVGWRDPGSAAGFDDTPVARSWRGLASAYCRIDLDTIASRGRWAGRTPFAVPANTPGHEGAVLALTRARLRPARALSFWQAQRPVAAAAATAPGLIATFGIGEAPIGVQGTVSVWRAAADLVEFAYRHPAHRRAIAATPVRRWYAEELFARFAVVSIAGDRGVIGWQDETRESS